MPDPPGPMKMSKRDSSYMPNSKQLWFQTFDKLLHKAPFKDLVGKELLEAVRKQLPKELKEAYPESNHAFENNFYKWRKIWKEKDDEEDVEIDESEEGDEEMDDEEDEEMEEEEDLGIENCCLIL